VGKYFCLAGVILVWVVAVNMLTLFWKRIMVNTG